MGLLKDVLVQANGIKVENEFEKCASDQSGCEVCWQVMVKEELATHDEERNIVGGPAEEEEAGAVVKAGAGSWTMSMIKKGLGRVQRATHVRLSCRYHVFGIIGLLRLYLQRLQAGCLLSTNQ